MAEPNDPRDSAHWDEVEEAVGLLEEERYHEALVELRDVLRRSPNNPYAYHFLGVAFFESSQLEPARDAYRAALRASPNYLGSRVALSNVLRMLGDVEGALKEASEALRRFPNDGEAAHAAGLAYAAKGDRGKARAHLEDFLASKPELEAELEVRQILEMLGIAENDGPVEFQ